MDLLIVAVNIINAISLSLPGINIPWCIVLYNQFYHMFLAF